MDAHLPGVPRRLWHQNLSFPRDSRLLRILDLAGHELRFGLPGPDDGVLVWGRSPTAWRGEAVAARRGVPLVRVEDAFLRSIHPGRSRQEPPVGLLIDPVGVHFDSSAPSRIEEILAATVAEKAPGPARRLKGELPLAERIRAVLDATRGRQAAVDS